MVKIIDCFIFYNEINMLNLRLHELNNYVDLFILVESKHTFSLNEKPLYYQENKHLFNKFNHKIIHFVVDDMDKINSQSAWDRESHQRNCILKCLRKNNIDKNDIILISDVDEIPNPKRFDEIKFRLIQNRVSKLVLCQRFFYYNFKCENKEKFINHKSRNTIAILYGNLNNTTPQYLRGRRGTFKQVHEGGWHCSYFGDSDEIINKIKQFSHQEYNNEKYLDKSKIDSNIKNCQDIFNRSNENWVYNDINSDKNLPFYKNLIIKNLILEKNPY